MKSGGRNIQSTSVFSAEGDHFLVDIVILVILYKRCNSSQQPISPFAHSNKVQRRPAVTRPHQKGEEILWKMNPNYRRREDGRGGEHRHVLMESNCVGTSNI